MILLFVGTPECESKLQGARDLLGHVFSEKNADRPIFVGLACLPIFLIVLALIYLRARQLEPRRAATLFIANLVLVAMSAFSSPTHVILFTALPAWWGWKCICAKA